MTSINDLSNDAQFANLADMHALERKMIVSDKSNAQKAIERMNAWAMDKHAMMFDCLGGLNAYKLKLIAEVITAKPLNIISNDDKLRRAADFLAHALQRLIKRVIEPTALQHPTPELTLNSGAINRILFSHFARDNTSQIDSTATQGV